MASSLHKFTVVEAQNASMGQAGVTLIADTNVHTAASGQFVAIQFITDTVFTTLTSDSTSFFGSVGATSTETQDTGSIGTTSGVTFPAGMTIYGRWLSFQLVAGGKVIAYLG